MRATGLIITSFVLAGCATQQDGVRSVSNEAASVAEATSFEQANARLKYAAAHIAYNASGCAVYRGIASNGRPRQEVLRDASNRPICDYRRVDDFISRWLLDSR